MKLPDGGRGDLVKTSRQQTKAPVASGSDVTQTAKVNTCLSIQTTIQTYVQKAKFADCITRGARGVGVSGW